MILSNELAKKCNALTKADVTKQFNEVLDFIIQQEVKLLTETDKDQDIYKIQGRLALLNEFKDLRQRILDAVDEDR